MYRNCIHLYYRCLENENDCVFFKPIKLIGNLFGKLYTYRKCRSGRSTLIEDFGSSEGLNLAKFN